MNGHRGSYRGGSRSFSRGDSYRNSSFRNSDSFRDNSFRSDRSRGDSYDSRPTYNRKLPDRENPPTSKCVGVFGLSLQTREKDLLEYFSRYGIINDVNIIVDNKTGRSRGFAFISFENLNSAVLAKDRAHGQEVDGRTIRTEFSVTRGPHSPTPGVYLGKPTRSPINDRRGGRIPRDRGGYRDGRGPPRSYDRRPPPRRRSPPPMRAPMRGRSRSPIHRRRNMPDRTNPPTSKCIGVFGLSLRTQDRDLFDIFSRYGVVDKVNLVIDYQTGRSRGFAFIYYLNEKDAEEAKERAHGIEIDGREVRCEFSLTEKAHSPTPGVYLGKPNRNRSRSPLGRPRISRSRSRSFERRY